jgi:hypothetical protein
LLAVSSLALPLTSIKALPYATTALLALLLPQEPLQTLPLALFGLVLLLALSGLTQLVVVALAITGLPALLTRLDHAWLISTTIQTLFMKFKLTQQSHKPR